MPILARSIALTPDALTITTGGGTYSIPWEQCSPNNDPSVGVAVAYYYAWPTDKKAMDALEAAEQAVKQPCAAVLRKQDAAAAVEAAIRQKAAAEEAARREEAASAKHAADFREGILAALRAADEADPFASIRGGFDFSGSDSRLWKTSLQLPDAVKCGLLKTSPATPTSGSDWTFACTFRATGDGYEGMVKSVQSVLQLPYQPDENAVNINQVFFADPSKQASRVFVAKINEATVGISVVAVRSVGTSFPTPSAAPFSALPTMLPTEPTIGEEIERIRTGSYTPLPPIQSTGVPARNGMGVFEVRNKTPYTLTAMFGGPTERRVEVAPSGSISIDLPTGSYKVVGRVNAPNFLPSYGEYLFDAGVAGIEFYIP